jgi:hypothetical protein
MGETNTPRSSTTGGIRVIGATTCEMSISRAIPSTVAEKAPIARLSPGRAPCY